MDPSTATVVGGGPAGLFAAEVLARAGVSVTVFEHRASVGRKFLLAGRGGLNITHSEPLDELLSRYGPQRSRLEDAVQDFTPTDLRAWCAELGEPCFVGTSGRVFPESLKATPLLRSWLRRLDELGVDFCTRHTWTGWSDGDEGELRFAHNGDDISVAADVAVLALGGASWPRVSTDGFWAEMLRAKDIAVAPLQAANCGVRTHWTTTLSDRFAGVPLKNVAVVVGDHAVRGDLMITEAGFEGGPIYAHSAALRDLVDSADEWTLHVDLHPDLSETAIVDRLTSVRRPKDSISTWLRKAKVAPAAIAVLRDVTANNIPVEPAQLAALLKAVPIAGRAMMPIDRAISTAGGVTFDQLTDNFMLAEHPGVFVAGEMLDWEAPTGGYLLQACFSTASAAAHGALRYLGNL